jgi:hypothetical protein
MKFNIRLALAANGMPDGLHTLRRDAEKERKGKSGFRLSAEGDRGKAQLKEKGSGLTRIDKRLVGKGKANLFCYRGKGEEDVRFVFYYRGMDNTLITDLEKEHARDHGRSAGSEIT